MVLIASYNRLYGSIVKKNVVVRLFSRQIFEEARFPYRSLLLSTSILNDSTIYNLINIGPQYCNF